MTWTAPADFLSGVTPDSAWLNQYIRDNFKAIGDAWTPYTPVWSSTGTAVALGNGTITGSYMSAGKYLVGRIRLTMGSTTTYGTGGYNFTLPPFALASGAFWESIGGCSARDVSGNLSYGLNAMSASASVISAATNAGGRLGQLVPFTFATTDIISLDFAYEAA